MHDVRRRSRQRRRGRCVSIANARLNGAPGAAAAGRFAALVSLPNILLAGCVVVAAWFVFVPLSALIYNAFTEDTGFGPGAFSLDNFVEAYSSWHILRLFWNSLVFAVGTALTTLVMGALVAWVVERTDAPGGSLFHTLSLLSFAVPGLLMAMAWIFVFSPHIGWGNAVLKSAFGLTEAPVNIYSMAGMTWALSSHYFPLAYLVLGPALRALDVRMEEAALMAGGSYPQVFAKVTLPLLRPAILSALLLLFVMVMASYEVPRLIGRPARIDVQIFLRIMLPLLAPVLLAGWIYVFVLAVRELGASIFLVGPGTHVLGTISLTMWEEGGSYGAVAALGVIQIVPLIVTVAGLRSIELRIQRRAQVQSS